MAAAFRERENRTCAQMKKSPENRNLSLGENVSEEVVLESNEKYLRPPPVKKS